MKFVLITYFITGFFETPGVSSVRRVQGYAVQLDAPLPVPMRLCVRRETSALWRVEHWDTGWLIPHAYGATRSMAVRSAVAHLSNPAIARLVQRHMRTDSVRACQALTAAARSTRAA